MRSKKTTGWKAMGIAAVLAGLCSMGAQAAVTVTIDNSQMTAGYINVFELDGATWQFGSAWDIADLSATFNGSGYEVTMTPNSIGDTAEYWYVGGGAPGNPGNKVMEAALYNEVTGALAGQTVVFSGNVISNTLTTAHTAVAFVRNFTPDYSSFFENTVTLPSAGEFSVSLYTEPNPSHHVQYGLRMKGVNVWVTDLESFGSVVVTVPADDVAPTPDPMGFAVAPYATSSSAISMSASNAVDNLTGVEYYFSCTGNPAFDSGWQSSTAYAATGLSPLTEYTFTVKARDVPHQNETAPSDALSATTLSSDPNPPTPNPMSFADSGDASPVSIKLTATTATDDQTAVEYFFSNTVNGVVSGWQTSTVYVESGLVPGSNYAYTVTARDLNSNMTAPSGPLAVTTWAMPGSFSLTNSLQGITGDTDQALTVHELAKLGLTTGSIHPDATIGFSTNGATFGQGVGYPGRNVLKTMASGYGNASFEAYATLTFSGAGDLSGFIGMGQGIITGVPGNWGIPEFQLDGVNGVVAQFKDTTAGSGTYNCNLFKLVSGAVDEELLTAPVGSTETIRARIVYNADSNTVSVSIDKNYDGGEFVPDQLLGEVSTALSDTNGVYSMWTNAPVHIYVGGGEGTVVKDFVIIAEGSAPVIAVDDLMISSIGGGMLLTWSSVAGQTYDVVYKTALTAGSWQPDPSPGCSNISGTGGSISATSTLGDSKAFYRVTTE